MGYARQQNSIVEQLGLSLPFTEWRRLHLQDIQEGKISAQDKMAWNNDFGLKSLEMIPRLREYFEQRRPEAAKFLAKYDPTDDILLNLGRGMLT